MITIIDLPEDILAIIFSFLEAEPFLAFCQSCKEVYQYRQDPAFWRNITSSTFRLPISPLLKADGARWYWLYKRLRTQTKLYTWGQGLRGNLGPGRSMALPRTMRGRMTMPPRPHQVRPVVATFERASSTWPTEVHVPDEVGVIADLQCGGWSTSILSSSGKLYTVGLIDSSDGRVVGEAADHFTQLEYVTQSTTAIRQFSSGRRHILALTDNGEVVSWDRINAKGLKIFSQTGRDLGGKAVRVTAGWVESSAYVPEAGIVYWAPVTNDQQDDMLDGIHVKLNIIPHTARHVTNENLVVEVVTHVVLEAWIIWLTNDGKLFASSLHQDDPRQTQPTFSPFEVPGYTSSSRIVKDVQGQFNKFAVFTENGEVLAGDVDYLRLCFEKARAHPSLDDQSATLPPAEWSRLDELIRNRPMDNPALQHNQVVSLAFGDHHYHALHINGTITSYGNDSQSCGALGLGDMQTGGRFRGLRTFQNFRPDSRLLPQAERRGRHIWFEPEKRDWLKFMEETLMSGKLRGPVDDQGNQRSAVDLWTPISQRQYMFSEWVEQEGRHWEDGPLANQNVTTTTTEMSTTHEHDFHLNSHFALNVSAAGWHSGALVLVDEEKANTILQKWTTKVPDDMHERLRTMPGHFETGPADPEEAYVWQIEGFPKIQLPDGFEMPGEGTVRPWRDGQPTMAELGLGPVA